MKTEVNRIIILTGFIFASCIFVFGLLYLTKSPKFDSVKADWKNLRLVKDININVDGKLMPVRVLCVDPAHVYILYQGRFYALNGMATEMGGERLRSEYGTVPVSAKPPYELHANTSDLIQICDDWFKP